MKVLQLIGRFFFGLVFLVNGIAGHFMSHDLLSRYAGSKGVPFPEVLIIITGIMIVLGGLSVITGYRRKLGLWLLVAFLVPVAFIMHDFWAVPPEQAMAERAQFMKDMALAGAAAIMIAFATDEPWPYSLGRWSSKLDAALPGPQAGPDVEPPAESHGTRGAAEGRTAPSATG